MIQTQVRRNSVRHESFEKTKRITMPLNRVPSLAKIVAQFESGQPIDANLPRNLEYNDFERMPIYSKGFDLIDAYKVAKRNGATLEQLNNEVEQAINAKKLPDPVQNPNNEPPINLNQE